MSHEDYGGRRNRPKPPERFLASFTRMGKDGSEGAIKVTVAELDGQRLIQVHRWQRSPSRKWFATTNGFTFRRSEIDALVAALVDAKAMTDPARRSEKRGRRKRPGKRAAALPVRHEPEAAISAPRNPQRISEATADSVPSSRTPGPLQCPKVPSVVEEARRDIAPWEE